MATYTTIDPTCTAERQTVLVGNIGLLPNPDVGADAAFVLHVDVITTDEHLLTPFHFITLVLEIIGPDGALFVDHPGRNNYHWDVPDGAGGWIEATISTSDLRARLDAGTLLSSPGNGATFYVGVAGLSPTDALELNAVAVGEPRPELVL